MSVNIRSSPSMPMRMPGSYRLSVIRIACRHAVIEIRFFIDWLHCSAIGKIIASSACSTKLADLHDYVVLFCGCDRVAGRPVRSGQPYLVGERGPEVFLPTASGNSVPRLTAPGIGPPMIPSHAVTARDRRCRCRRSQTVCPGMAGWFLQPRRCWFPRSSDRSN